MLGVACHVSQPESSPPAAGPPLPAAYLWPVAVLAFGVGDVVTTAIGLRVVGVVELNPVVAGLIGGSFLGAMVGVKLLVLCAGYLLCRWLPRAPAVGVPLGLAILGLVVTVWNFHVVLRGATG